MTPAGELVACGELGTVYAAGDGGYHTLRIPAVVATGDGALLAFAEGRRTSAGDAGPIDLVVRRSLDGGLSWGPLQVVCADADNTVGNPCPVVDPQSGDVVLVYVRTAGAATEERILRGDVDAADSRRVWVRRSRDSGTTWTPADDITRTVKRPSWRWYATGPGHAIALRDGPYAGRLVIPANHSVAAPSAQPGSGYGGHLLLSDDGGLSWRIGAQAPAGDGGVYANETTVAELPDGRLYLNTRNQGASDTTRDQSGGNATRAHAWSSSGGETLDRPYAPAAQLRGPVVQNSVLAVAGRVLLSGPGEPRVRRRLVVRSSCDSGRTWRETLCVWAGPAAYSDLVDLGEGRVGLLFEHGQDSAYERIGFARLQLG